MQLEASSIDWNNVKTIAVEDRRVFAFAKDEERVYEFESDEQLTAAVRAWAERSGGVVQMVR